MPTLDAKLQAAADAALDAAVTALRSRQAGVRGAAGRYRQVITNHTWGTWGAYKPDAAIVQRVSVDEYLSPDGPGWSITAQVTDAGGLVWRRTIHVAGPETWREHGWEQYDPETI